MLLLTLHLAHISAGTRRVTGIKRQADGGEEAVGY